MDASYLDVLKARLDRVLGKLELAPDLVVGNPAHGKGDRIKGSLRSLSTQAAL